MQVNYQWGNANRLTGVIQGIGRSGSTDLGTLTYAYDVDGRRTAGGATLAATNLPAPVAGGTSTAYNADNEQTAFNGVSLSYDPNGNLTADRANTYTWDARNHLSTIGGAGERGLRLRRLANGWAG
jgi:hypothetical protein